MFAILQISDNNTIFRQPKIQSQRFDLPSGDAFFTVTAEKHLGKVPWKKLEKCLGILRKGILLPDGATLPTGINITCFSPDILPRLLLMNSATHYITNHKESFIRKSLTIFDEKGIYQSYIEKLLPCFSSIRIVTDSPKKYTRLSEALLETYGFSLLLSKDEAGQSDVVISHAIKVPLYFEGIVFTNENRYLMNSEIFSGSEINLPEAYESLRPEGIDRVPFASALYESCKENSLAEIRYKNFGS